MEDGRGKEKTGRQDVGRGKKVEGGRASDRSWKEDVGRKGRQSKEDDGEAR